MSDERSERTIDPELLRQLDAARTPSALSATFVLRARTDAPLSAAETHATVRRIIKRAEEESEQSAHDFQVFENIQSFAVSGPPALIRRLTEQPEIDSALANVQSQDLLIRPVESKHSQGQSTKKDGHR